MRFTEKYQQDIHGTLFGFDRMIFNGYFFPFQQAKDLFFYLNRKHVLLKEFDTHAKELTGRIDLRCHQLAAEKEATYHYLNFTKGNKAKIVEEEIEKSGKTEGLITVIACLEVCSSFRVKGRQSDRTLQLQRGHRKCKCYYLYYLDKEFGLMYVKLQGWFPFNASVYINGRSYLKAQLKNQGVEFTEYKNSIQWCSDLVLAQKLLDRLHQKKWDRILNAMLTKVHPFLEEMQKMSGHKYKWYMDACEGATDVLFKEHSKLKELYPDLVNRAIHFKGGEDVYTFFGKTLLPQCSKEVQGSKKRFDQGFRVKHILDRNTIKMYDKGCALRIEVTINNPEDSKYSGKS